MRPAVQDSVRGVLEFDRESSREREVERPVRGGLVLTFLIIPYNNIIHIHVAEGTAEYLADATRNPLYVRGDQSGSLSSSSSSSLRPGTAVDEVVPYYTRLNDNILGQVIFDWPLY